MPAVLLSVVTWNSADSIAACLRSVLAQSYSDFEVWVVDNDSHDETREVVAALAATDARLHLHALPRNTGFCGGHNYALDRTATDLVLLVNPDVEMAPDYLARAVAAIGQDERIGTVCGLLVQSTESDPRIDSAGMVALPDGRFALRLHGLRLSEAGPLAATTVDGADGALPLFRRRFIDDLRVQGEFFDSRFFAHKEDWDIAWRGRLYGWHTRFEPACQAVHPRQFVPANLRLRRRLGSAIKADAVKNQWLLLLKNPTRAQLPALLLRAVPRQLGIVLYALLAERASLRAVRYLWQHWSETLVSRRLIQARARQGWPPPSAPHSTKPPLLSICIPTCHRPERLARALRSVGTLPPDVELLVSDNSTANDSSEQLTRHILEEQPTTRWRYYRTPPGGNASTNWQACLARARGHYILLLSDNDYLLPGGLMTMASVLRQARDCHHAVLFGVQIVDVHRRELQRQVPARAHWLAPDQAVEALLTNSSLVRIPALVISRQAYQQAGGPDLGQEPADDTDLWLRIFARTGVQLESACTAAYTVHTEAPTTDIFQERSIRQLLRIFQKARTQQLLPESRLQRAAARFFHQFVLAGAYRALRQHDAATARQVLRLFELPELRQLPLPARWLPARLSLGLLARLSWPAPARPTWRRAIG